VRELVDGKELDPLKRQSSLPDLVFQDTPSLSGSVLEEGYMCPCHAGTLHLFKIKSYSIL
jgi:hypothetical protein